MSIQNPVPSPMVSFNSNKFQSSPPRTTPHAPLLFGASAAPNKTSKTENKSLLDKLEEFLEKHVSGFFNKLQSLIGPVNRLIKTGQVLIHEFQRLGEYSALVEASTKIENEGKTTPSKTDPSAYFNLFFNVFLAKSYSAFNQPIPPENTPGTNGTEAPTAPPTPPSKALLGLYQEIITNYPGISKIAEGKGEARAEVKSLAKEIMNALAYNQEETKAS